MQTQSRYRLVLCDAIAMPHRYKSQLVDLGYEIRLWSSYPAKNLINYIDLHKLNGTLPRSFYFYYLTLWKAVMLTEVALNTGLKLATYITGVLPLIDTFP